jgi:hypothetical protein
MRYDDHATFEKLWLDLAASLIKKYGAVRAAGVLAGILARQTKTDADLKRELKKRIEEA